MHSRALVPARLVASSAGEDERLTREAELERLQSDRLRSGGFHFLDGREELIPTPEVEEHPRRLGLRPPVRTGHTARHVEPLLLQMQVAAVVAANEAEVRSYCGVSANYERRHRV
jgi:hypothetical protein